MNRSDNPPPKKAKLTNQSEQQAPFTFPSDKPKTEPSDSVALPSKPSQRIPLKARPSFPKGSTPPPITQPFQPAPITPNPTNRPKTPRKVAPPEPIGNGPTATTQPLRTTPITSSLSKKPTSHQRTAPLRPPAKLQPTSITQPIHYTGPTNKETSSLLPKAQITEAVQAAKPMSPFTNDTPDSEPQTSDQSLPTSDLDKASINLATAVIDEPAATITSTPFDPAHFSPQETIRKQREGEEISDEEISMFVQGIANHSVSDAQCAAYAMAVCLCGMTGGELVSLTKCMRDSGEVLSWDLDGPILDQDTIGGTGDISPILLAPMLAACGAYAPMIIDRNFKETLDQLHCIPGYQFTPETQLFQDVVKEIGCAIVGNEGNLTPADQRLHEIRETTATLETTPLLTASIISKKLARGIKSFVLNIKIGDGTFIQDITSAQKLARKVSNVAHACGLKCSSIITDTSQPLAHSKGSSLELKEAIRFIHTSRGRNKHLYELVMAQGEELLIHSGIAQNAAEAREKLDYSLDSGSAAEQLGKMIRALGGPADFVERPNNYLKEAAVIKPIFLKQSGVIHKINTQEIDLALDSIRSVHFKTKNMAYHSIGLTEIRGISKTIDSRTPVAILHASSEDDWEHAAKQIQQAYQIDKTKIEASQPIIERIKPI